jgi:hypothetical protein
MKEKLIPPLNVINDAQQRVWTLHHAVKQYNEELAMQLWECSLQIESALLKINESVFEDVGYYENKDT